jgi:hypothetical protein
LFEGNGASVSGTTTTPTAFAGSEHFTGAGAVAGSSTFSSGGTIFPRSPFTGTYTLNANCTGTLTIGTSLHFDLYAAPSGDRFTYVQTDPGSVSAATETRVAHSCPVHHPPLPVGPRGDHHRMGWLSAEPQLKR